MNRKRILSILLPLFLLVPACRSQERSVDRRPAVAGQFYPAGAGDLGRELAVLFSHALPRKDMRDVAAIIVPHAGYSFSGEVAASGFNQIDPDKEYENIFVIGPSHHVGFEGGAVDVSGDYVTPLGKVTVNRELGRTLIEKCPLFTRRTDAHAEEHSVEVELPFLQHHLKKPFQIVPIVVGAGDPESCRRMADALRPYFNDSNLFIISSDFSHYPGYDDAVRIDRATADAITSNAPEKLVSLLRRSDGSGVPGLVTPLCGWSAVLTLLYMTSGTDIQFAPIEYRNSGDAGLAGRDRVVGYWSIAVSRKEPVPGEFSLGENEKAELLAIARTTLSGYLAAGTVPELDEKSLTPALQTACGAFVTLTRHGALRGCIGRFDATQPLYRVVREMAIASATQDTRFVPVEPSELDELTFEISVLTPMRKINSIDEFHLGKQGIYIRKGPRSGTFLPQVAAETGWTKEEFLGHCARDKAGIGWDGWKDAELFVYEALVFSEK